MPVFGIPQLSSVALQQAGITNENIHYQETPEMLTGHTLRRKEGRLAGNGALAINTGKFTGRSPQDKFIVLDTLTKDTVDWGSFNLPLEEKYFLQLKEKMTSHLNAQPELWIRDARAGAVAEFSLRLRVINEDPWSNLFVHNMFLQPENNELPYDEPEWLVLHAPSFEANPAQDGTRQTNFAAISFTHQTLLIGGTGYTGEIKKGIFTVLNFLLPLQYNILPMHCSATLGKKGDTAIYFGLSGTGKTTLSADPTRRLIGDDEHGWFDGGVFNFEGGCYAKVIDLHPDREPAIYNAIRPGALLENVGFREGTNEVDYADKTLTENTRVSYPLSFIPGAVIPSIGAIPSTIFFLSADAHGVLPPISRLTTEQAMYYFLSGYTARVAGTEAGVREPKATFSACFGAPFLPLPPKHYANLLEQKLERSGSTVWLVNTGWIGGPYGIGTRIPLQYTRTLIKAALDGSLNRVRYLIHPVLGLQMPLSCNGIPEQVLNPYLCWGSREIYEMEVHKLVNEFAKNMEKYQSFIKAFR